MPNDPKYVNKTNEIQEATVSAICRDENLSIASPRSKLFQENCFTSYSLVDNNPSNSNQRYPITFKNSRGNKKEDDNKIFHKSLKSKKLSRIQTQLKLTVTNSQS